MQLYSLCGVKTVRVTSNHEHLPFFLQVQLRASEAKLTGPRASHQSILYKVKTDESGHFFRAGNVPNAFVIWRPWKGETLAVIFVSLSGVQFP